MLVPMAGAVYCPQCGRHGGDADKFCPRDGTNLQSLREALAGEAQSDPSTLLGAGGVSKQKDEGTNPEIRNSKFEVRDSGSWGPELPEEVGDNQLVVDPLHGELLSSRTRVSAFVNDTLKRITGEPIKGRMVRRSFHGEKRLAFQHLNVVLEKYQNRSHGSLTVVQPGAPLSRILQKALDTKGPLTDGYEVLGPGGIRFGMKMAEVRVIFAKILESRKDTARPLVYDREWSKKGFLTLAYKVPRKWRHDYRVEFVFDSEDQLIAFRFGFLKER